MISVILLVAVTWALVALVALGVGTVVGRVLAAGEPAAHHHPNR